MKQKMKTLNNKEIRIINENKYIDLIEVTCDNVTMTGIKHNDITVGVLPYTLENELLSSIGILKEFNLFRDDNYCNTVITGTYDDDDKTLLNTAKRELLEEGGIKCLEDDLWIFLGSFKLSKSSTETIHMFAVNISNKEIKKAVGDGSRCEELSSFKLIPINLGTLSSESILLASYMRLFDIFYQMNK